MSTTAPSASRTAPDQTLAHDRAPPASTEAEVAVLGGMLIDSDAVARAMEIVSDAMFSAEAHRRIFRAALRLFERGQATDVIIVADELRKSDELEAAGGYDYLAELLDAVPTAANIEYHAGIVRDKALLRRLIDASSQTIRDVYEQGKRPVEEVVDEAEQRIFQVATGHDREGFVRIKKLLWPAMERIDQLQEAKGELTGVATGFEQLDRITGGLQKGNLVIVAGRPSMGKTSWALNVARHAADQQVPVGVFSLEMSKEELVQRLLCSDARVDAQRVRRGELTGDESQRLGVAAGRLNTAPMWIDDSAGSTVLEVRAKARRLKAESQLGLLVIDYLQLMTGSRNSENRQQEVTDISRGLKALAKELEVPVVALSQLSRAPEQRADHRPQLSDLRESGSIEQDADLVTFLYRPEYYADTDKDGNSLVGKAELIVSKQRNGPTGVVPLYFHSSHTRFDSVVPDGDMATVTPGGRSGSAGGFEG